MTNRAIVAEQRSDLAHFLVPCNIAVPQAMQRLVGSQVKGRRWPYDHHLGRRFNLKQIGRESGRRSLASPSVELTAYRS